MGEKMTNPNDAVIRDSQNAKATLNLLERVQISGAEAGPFTAIQSWLFAMTQPVHAAPPVDIEEEIEDVD